MVEAVEIIPDLWLGNLESSVNFEFQSSNEINCLVNCIKDLKFWGKYKEYNDLIKDSIERHEILKMYKYLLEVTEFIYHSLKNNKIVLVFCENCEQKSSTVLSAYLIRYGNMNIETAIQIIKSKCNKSFINKIDFLYALEKFYKNINEKKN